MFGIVAIAIDIAIVIGSNEFYDVVVTERA